MRKVNHVLNIPVPIIKAAFNFKADSMVATMFLIGWASITLGFIGDYYKYIDYGLFPRCGAILSMLSISAEFKQLKYTPEVDSNDLDAVFKNHEHERLGIYPECLRTKQIKKFAHFSLFMGTLIWAFGDLIFAST